MMKKIIILILLLVPIRLFSAPCDADLAKAKDIIRNNLTNLKKSYSIISNEKLRWNFIHLSNNTTYTLIKKSDYKYVVDLSIDTKYSNEINNLPIEREITIQLNPPPSLTWFPFDFMCKCGVGYYNNKVSAIAGLGVTVVSFEPCKIPIIDKTRLNLFVTYPLGISIDALYNLNFFVFKYSYLSIGYDLIKRSLDLSLDFKL
jgi:hypothetical protein